MNIYQHIDDFLAKHKSAALCIVTGTFGSTPRKIGSKMLVAPNGTTLGTIGGGAIEQQVIDEAKECIKTNKPLKKNYQLETDLRMQCGGNVEVYIEPLGNPTKLYIFGAGHVGKALADFAKKVDFDITLLDFRPISFTDEEKNAYHFIHGDYFESLETLEYDDNTYSVIMTPTHDHDFELLKRLGKKPFAYLGMIGSKKKVAKVKEILVGEGHYTEEEFSAFDTPMGIEMAAETPEEIAISILAKMIDVRNKKINS
jgi:xanthine dehydrogenase accessory factor